MFNYQRKKKKKYCMKWQNEVLLKIDELVFLNMNFLILRLCSWTHRFCVSFCCCILLYHGHGTHSPSASQWAEVTRLGEPLPWGPCTMGRGEECAWVLLPVQKVSEQESEEMTSNFLYHSDTVCEIYVVQFLLQYINIVIVRSEIVIVIFGTLTLLPKLEVLKIFNKRMF